MSISLKEFAKKRYSDFVKSQTSPLVQATCRRVMDRMVKDLGRIADSRLIEGEILGKLSFTWRQVGEVSFVVIPSDPVLFKKLEWGEFNEDGTYKIPPHSILQELRVTVRMY
jgi:hypothetical protein